jgi:hypothetical protein
MGGRQAGLACCFSMQRRHMRCATGTRPGVERVIHRTPIEAGSALGRVL